MALDDDTARHDLATGKRRPFRAITTTDEGDDSSDAIPRVSDAKRLPSASILIEDAFKASAEMGKALERGETPTKEQLQRMRTGAEVYRLLRDELGALVLGGGSGRGSWKPIMAAIAAALGINLGFDAFGSADAEASQAQAVAEAKVQADVNARDVSDLRRRQDEAERKEDERDRTLRRNLGMTVRWLGDQQDRNCDHTKAIADGVNLLVRRELARRGDDDEFVPIKIDCDSEVIPPELEVLRASAREDTE